jgi:dTDP-4-amino-4,6-dideoxygalactose transaminase/predicted dehydrogenase
MKPMLGASRAAVIGCGRIAPTHVSGYEQCGGAYVAAVSDLSPTVLAAFLDEWPFVRGFRRVEQMLREVGPDLVSVCTWPQSHAAIVCQAARAEVKGILCEKPIALQLVEIEEMLGVCRSTGTKLACGHQYRFHPVFLRLSEAIRRGQPGSVCKVAGAIRGSLANNGPHLIDTIRFVLGDPAAVSVSGQCRREHDTIERGLPCEESATVRIEFAGGIVCEIETGRPEAGKFSIEVIGSEGTLVGTPDSLTIDGKRTKFDFGSVIAQCRARQFREFVRWVRGKQPSYAADAEQAAKTTEIVLAGYESARLGRPVELPLLNRGDVIRELYPISATAEEQAVGAARDVDADAKLPMRYRLALDGGERAVKNWFSSAPVFGVAEARNLSRVLISKKLNRVGGRFVPQLEREVAAMYGSPCVVASTSGTSAIHVALAALNPEPCDEVITSPLTDMGSVIPILASNCIPIFADVDPETGNLTADSIAAKITSRTRAVIVVHLFGRPAVLPPIVDLLRSKGIALVEDCAQAHLAEYAGKKVGTYGDFGCFSLQQSKQITCGDGGLTLVNRPELGERAQLFADKGWARGGARNHKFLGWNYRMTELQGAVALAQLRRLPRLIKVRRSMAERLAERLSGIRGVVLPPRDANVACSWWKFPFGIEETEGGRTTDEVFDALRVEGVRMMRHYLPRPLFEEPMIRCRRTYGQSGYPLSASWYVQPDIADFPGLQQFNRRWCLMDWSNRVKRRHVEAIYRAVEKVVVGCGGLPTSEREKCTHLASIPS